jgi:hypothetical protein
MEAFAQEMELKSVLNIANKEEAGMTFSKTPSGLK